MLPGLHYIPDDNNTGFAPTPMISFEGAPASRAAQPRKSEGAASDDAPALPDSALNLDEPRPEALRSAESTVADRDGVSHAAHVSWCTNGPES
eukprot:2044558-Prymnesium_polylepis.2